METHPSILYRYETIRGGVFSVSAPQDESVSVPTKKYKSLSPVTSLFFLLHINCKSISPHQGGWRPCTPYTPYYGDKILYRNLDLTQDFPNKILFHSLWGKNLVRNLPKIIRLTEMCSVGKILAQDFQMATITKILMRRE